MFACSLIHHSGHMIGFHQYSPIISVLVVVFTKSTKVDTVDMMVF